MKIIKSEAEYTKALERLESLMDISPDPDTELGEELELLVFLLEKYEEERFPISILDPVDAIKFRMEQQGLNYSDMIPYFGSKSKVSEVLNRKRSLSLSMIRKLKHEFGIPADVLIADPKKNTSGDQ